MDVNATDAKNRFGQMLEAAQREPVVIAKSGRRHSVLISAAQYDALKAAARAVAVVHPPAPPLQALSPQARTFYEQHKAWVDDQNRQFEAYGVWNQEFRTW